MARPNLTEIRGAVDFQKTYYWEITVNGPGVGFMGLMGADGLNLLATSTEIPRWEGETALQMIKGYQVPDPGIYKPVSKMTLSFVDMVDRRVSQGWDNWMSACRNKPVPFNGLYANFILTTTDNQGAVNYQYNLTYCFPDATEPQELDSDNSNPMKYKVVLRYSDVRVTEVDQDGAEQAG